MIKIIGNSYKIKIANMTFQGENEYPIITHILKGMLEWHRNGISAINIISEDDKYVLLLTEQQAYIIENSTWPRYQALPLDSETIIKEFLSDISKNIDSWAFFESEAEKEFNEKKQRFKELLSVVTLYHEAIDKGIDFKLIHKAELKYADFLIASSCSR